LAEPTATPAYDDWGAAIYLSNDDTMSLSSAQRVIYAIDQFLPLPIEHIRPHELLNYFSFESALVEEGYDFSVLGGLARDPASSDIFSLALSVRGRPVDLRSRRNAALTLVVDRSGSMDDEGRMSFLKRGLRVMLGQLKAGDIVNLVAFDDEVCVPAEGFVVGRDSMRELEQAIDALAPRGSTDLHRGLTRGYELADKTYQKSYTNRVLLVTDALTNTGVTDEALIATVSRYFDNRRIRLSGVGVGREFNDSLLDKLTERGKGAYVFLGSQAEVDAVFGSHFLSLIETTANDVRFRLHLPPSLRMQVFYGEESSTVAADVQEIHYFANTSQLFLSDLMAKGGALRPDDEIMLSIEYRDPETDESLVEQSSMRLGDLAADPRNIAKARLIMTWIDLIAQMAQSSQATNTYGRPGGWDDPAAFARCEQGTAQLDRLSSDIGQDPEVRRVLGLWSKFCSRYERPRQPVRRQIAAPPPDAWPGANQPSR
jgi:Ca-activated chloride channel family protein